MTEPVFVCHTQSGNVYRLYENRTWSCDRVDDGAEGLLTDPANLPTLWPAPPQIGQGLFLYWWHPEEHVWKHRTTSAIVFIHISVVGALPKEVPLS